MKKIFLSLIVLISTIYPSIANAQETDWKITNFSSAIEIRADGKVKISETIEVDFLVPKHGIFRDLPYKYKSDANSTIKTDIEDISVTDGNLNIPYSISNNNSNLRIKIGDPDKTIINAQKYVITYTVVGVLRNLGEFDELYWNVTGNDWPVEIEQVYATVTLPDEIKAIQSSCYQGIYQSTEACAKKDDTTFSSNRALSFEEGLTIAVSYPKDKIPILVGIGNTPLQKEYLKGLIAFLITIFIGSYFIFMRWWRHGRDELSGPAHQQTIIPEYDPPANLRPAEIGVLIDERADTLDISATIVDLAVRGYLTIKEIPKKWLFGSVDYEFIRSNKSHDELLEYERKLLLKLFISGNTVRLSSLENKFYLSLTIIKDELYKLITEKNIFAGNPEKIRQKYLIFGIVLFALMIFSAMVFGSLAFEQMTISLFIIILGIIFGLIIFGLILVISSFFMPRRTTHGSTLYRQALGYKLFVSGTEKYRQPFFEKQNLFMDVLPYAIVFGVTKKLANAFAEMGIEPQRPSWYVGTHPFVPAAFTSSIDNFSSSLSSAIASSPSGSGSGGGGSSGGGFGGGGGGSW